MGIFQGDTGIKILSNFNIFLSNARKPIDPKDAHGFLVVIVTRQNQDTPPPPIQVLFKVETTIPEDNFKIIDERLLALAIGAEVQKISSLNFFGSANIKVISVAMASGYDNSFVNYDMV